MEPVWQNKKLSVRAEVELYMGKKRIIKENFFWAFFFLMAVIHNASWNWNVTVNPGKRDIKRQVKQSRAQIKIPNPFQLHMHGMETDIGLYGMYVYRTALQI